LTIHLDFVEESYYLVNVEVVPISLFSYANNKAWREVALSRNGNGFDNFSNQAFFIFRPD
jgi:hypothetical protein